MFQCDQCEYEAEMPNNLAQHKRLKHPNVWHKCSQCDFTAATKSTTNIHIQIMHDNLSYDC